MTDEQKHELAKLEAIAECDRKMALLGMIFKTGLGLGVVAAWMYSTLAGMVATVVILGFWDGTSGSESTVRRNTDAQRNYMELGYLDRLQSGDISDE